jgi:uroporphyrin-III C-methyltransferase
MDSSTQRGQVVFVGAGPGAADLITLRGLHHLAAADVVLHDALTDPALRKHAPLAHWIHVGKRGYRDSTVQVEINALMVKHALRGARVVRLKGGDPSVFGRLEEELQALHAAGITTEVVPGVTAALAAAAAAQRPLTRRGSGRSVSLTTAVTQQGGTGQADTEAGTVQAGRRADTEVFYMASQRLAELSRRLLAAGWPADTPVLVVSRALWPDQIASDHSVATLPAASVLHSARPAVVTVGVGASVVANERGSAEQPSTPVPAREP